MTEWTYILRVLLAAGLSAAIGIEREFYGRLDCYRRRGDRTDDSRGRWPVGVEDPEHDLPNPHTDH